MSDDYGRDLASVQNLNKKHQLVEADIAAHEVSRVGPLGTLIEPETVETGMQSLYGCSRH